jgi:elongation factor Ts
LAEIKASDVKALRERTGAGMMDCKRALGDAGGDFTRAVELLRERGVGQALKRAGRETSEGRVEASVAPDGRRAALLEVNCETDFVAKTEDFQQLCAELAGLARERAPRDPESLLELPLQGRPARDRLHAAIAKLGENIRVRRVAQLEAGAEGRIGAYIHAGGRIGALVLLKAAQPDGEAVAKLAHDLCMHVVAASPLGITRDDIDPAEVEKERAVLAKQAQAEGKPIQIIDRMVQGRLAKFFRDVALVEQPLVMDPDLSVGEAARRAGAEVAAFRRFELGEATEA